MRVFAFGSLLLALPIGVASAQEETPRASVDAVLEQLSLHGDESQAIHELSELGVEALPPMFEALVDARGPGKRSLLGAFAAAPPGAASPVLTAALDAAPPPGPSKELQVAALSVLRTVGRSDDLELCLSAARVLGEETYAPRTRELTEALDAIFARDPALLTNVKQTWLRIEQRLRTPVARSVGNLGGDQALDFLTELLERDSNSAGMLLSQLGRASGGVSYEAAQRAADAARPYLSDDTEGIVKESAVTLARLQDDSAVPILIELLAEGSSGMAGNVHWALREITGLSIPCDETAWSAWHSVEERWWVRDSRRAFLDLQDRDPVVAGAAVRSIAEHRLARHTLAESLSVALEHRIASVRQDTADALARIGSLAAVPALRLALEDPDKLTRERARGAIVALTGEDPLKAEESVAVGF